jgi:hypothetical protein
MNYSLKVFYFINFLSHVTSIDKLNQLAAMMEAVLSGILKSGALLKSFEIMNAVLPSPVFVGQSVVIKFLYLLQTSHYPCGMS